MYKNLENYCKRYIHLTTDQYIMFEKSLSFKSIKKKDFLLKSGNYCQYHYFVLKGCFSFFYIDKSGAEQIVQFAIENWWFTDYESFVSELPSNVTVQALENSEILQIHKSKLDEVYKEIPAIERLFRIIAEKSLIAHLRRNYFLLSRTSEEKYDSLVNTFPDFAQRVPQYMIASYLGFSPEYLSKIRAKK